MRANPMAMLFALIGAVPLLAGGAGLAGLLLQRAGFGIVVWGLVPLFGLLGAVLVLGAVLGKAAGGRPDGSGEPRDRENRRDDGV